MLFGKKEKMAFHVNGMSCGHCEATVEKGLSGIAHVVTVKADSGKGVVEVTYKGPSPDLSALKEKVRSLGYEPVDE